MPTTPSTINYYIAADGTLRDGSAGSIAQTPRIYYGTEYAVTLSFPASTIVEGDQLQVAVNRTRTFFSSASATGDAPVAAVAKHEVTAEEADAQAVTLTLSTNTRAMIDQVNGIDHPVRGFFGVHLLRGQSFISLAIADAFMLSVESGPDAISPSLPVVDYPTREEAEALTDRSEAAAERAEQAAAGIVPPLQLSSPPTTSTGGSVGQLAVWHDSDNSKDHLYHLVYITTSENATLYHWEECVLESQRNVANGFAGLTNQGLIRPSQLPIATNIALGAVQVASSGQGIVKYNSAGLLATEKATYNDINNGIQNYKPIVPSNLNYAVRSVLPKVTEIPAATSDYSLVDSSATTNNHSHVYSHSPSAVPTYRLPSVSDTTVSHYIELTVDFTNVQTYSFLDSNGDALVPLFTPSIAAGDVYTFKMEYSAIKAKWLIYPQKQGAVADDFVMRGEVGAANGVAGLDGNAVVPQNQLPIPNQYDGTYGVVKYTVNYGIRFYNGSPYLYTAPNSAIDSRAAQNQNGYGAITPASINYAVTAALTDSNKISLNDTQKATAQEVFGVGGPITEIPAATSEYTLSEGIFKHSPTNAPTYNLPSITDTIRSHVIVLAIDFSSVQTFSFVPPQDSGVTFQSYANPNQGDVWVFRCVWYGGKWRICPLKIKNCVTRQLTSGALAITDAVAGDALALKMTAPRSVVVNQQLNNGDFSDGTNNWTSNGTMSVTDNILTTQAGSSTGTTMYIRQQMTVVSGHTYMMHMSAKCSIVNCQLSVLLVTNTRITLSTNVNTTTFDDLFCKFTASATETSAKYIYCDNNSLAVGDTVQYKDIMLVDLTQYFNGNTTLINSINTWDDLIAYDSTFASYVPYDTGTVKGVQPTVKVNHTTDVACPVELFGVMFVKQISGVDVNLIADSYDAISGRFTNKVGNTNLATLNWSYDTVNNSYIANMPIGMAAPASALHYNFIAEKYISYSAGKGPKPHGAIHCAGSRLYVKLESTESAPTGMLYYELATPTTEQYTPTQISLQAGNNVAMQTDGGRLAPIDVTYESNEI